MFYKLIKKKSDDKTILDEIELNNNQKNIFQNNNIALSLLTYSSLTDSENEESKKMLNIISIFY